MNIVTVRRAAPTDFVDDKRVTITTSMDGLITAVQPLNSHVFGFPSKMLLNCRVTDVIDVFDEWRKQTSSEDMQLVMLALLDREQEAPGCSWRVKVCAAPGAIGDMQWPGAWEGGMQGPKALIQLVMLALLDMEMETSGCSWCVKEGGSPGHLGVSAGAWGWEGCRGLRSREVCSFLSAVVLGRV